MSRTACSDTEIGKPDGSESRIYLRCAASNPIALSTALRTIKNAIGALRGLNGGQAADRDDACRW